MVCEIFGLLMMLSGAGLLWLCTDDACEEQSLELRVVFYGLVVFGAAWTAFCCLVDSALTKACDALKYVVTCRCVRRK